MPGDGQVSSKPPSDWKSTSVPPLEITDSTVIHGKLLERNAKHLQQAQNTPFAKGDLWEAIGWSAEGSVIEEILHTGRIEEAELEEVSEIYVRGLQVKDMSILESVKKEISIEEYKSFWKKKRESTVTSPFGLHIGHYKAACDNEDILEVHRLLLCLPFIYGFVPDRWNATVQLMLEKDPGRPWIHRLRIIELFDAQVNAGFQIFVGRRMIHKAMDKDLLHESSYGSTPGCTCQEASVHKVIMTDLVRLQRKVGVFLTVMQQDVLTGSCPPSRRHTHVG